MALSEIMGGCDSKSLAIGIAVVIIFALIVYGYMLWGMVKANSPPAEKMAPIRKISGGYSLARPFNIDTNLNYGIQEGYHDWEHLRKGGSKLSYENFKAGHDVNPVDLFDIVYGKK